MTSQTEKASSAPPPWGIIPPSFPPFLRELPIILVVFAVFYGLLTFSRYGVGPVNTQAEIRLDPGALPKYAAFSLIRIAIAYVLSLLFTFVYGYIAAYNSKAERFMIPLLDTLQSIPVLSFLPAVMVSMVALFPNRQLGVELGSIILIVTGQVWNMTFSFYSSLKSIPNEMREAAGIYRLSWWQRFTEMELPFAAIGLIWNSMMSVAGAWFFLMACEMFVLGNRDLRLPGLGSYLQTAANAGDTRAIIWGLAAMVAVIVLVDRLVWRPAIAWAEKFKFEQVEAAFPPHSPVLDLLRRSKILALADRMFIQPVQEALNLRFARAHSSPSQHHLRHRLGRLALWLMLVGGVLGVAYALDKMTRMLAALTRPEIRAVLQGAGATFLRVEATLLLAALWTIPVGLYIGLRPKLSAFAQPIAQIAASVPATALFPIILLLLIRLGGGLGIGSVVLLLLGTQWYILFNVIAGASAIPTDLREVCGVFRLRRTERWRTLLLPGIFPYLITGLVTASGGAWNASIVAEYFHFRGRTFSTIGLGSLISQATDSGNFPLLLAATITLAAMVITINRLVWRRLYTLASTRFKLES
jgi:NitT/TauT family transport system permease protein